MDRYLVVVKDGAIIKCTQDAAEACSFFTGKDACGIYKVESLADVRSVLEEKAPKMAKEWESVGSRWLDELRQLVENLDTRLGETSKDDKKDNQ